MFPGILLSKIRIFARASSHQDCFSHHKPNAKIDVMVGAAESELAEQECVKAKHH